MAGPEPLARGLERHQAGDLDAAEALYREALAHAPDDADALHLLGVLRRQRGDAGGARALIERAVAVRPAYPAALYNLASVAQEQGDDAGAAAAYERALALQPDFAEAWNNLSTAYRALGRRADAIDALRRAIALRPELGTAPKHQLLSTLLFDEDRFAEALEAAHAALARDPADLEAHVALTAAYNALELHEPALAACRTLIALAPGEPRGYANMALALHALARDDEALAACEEALRCDPRHVESYLSRAAIAEAQGRVADALADCRAAVALDPEYPKSRSILGAILLRAGDLRAGWPEYERWLLRPDRGWGKRYASRPRWNGEPFAGKRLLLTDEQGFGDALQMYRFVPRVKALGGTVWLETPPALLELAAGLGADALVEKGVAVAPARFDLHASLFSLPRIFGLELATIPHEVPYLHADPARVAAWRARLGTHGDALRVGLAWAGNPQYRSDRRRSLPLAAFAPLAKVAGIRWYSLQKGPAEDEAAPPGLALERLGPEFGSFAETAAAVAALDLVIAVDTGVAHLAGALGRPVWTLLYEPPDWRWLSKREDTPWYPTMRLFRQPRAGAWDPVLPRVAEALARLVEARR